MSRYMTNMNAGGLLAEMEKAQHITPTENAWLSDYIASNQPQEELSVLLRILLGVGAFISASFLMGFFSITGVIDFKSSVQLMFWGGIFVLNAIFMVRRAETQGLVGHSFLVQTSFCSIGIGKLLFVLGFMQLVGRAHDNWAANFAVLLITAAAWPFYKMSLDRFLSTCAVLFMLLINIVMERKLGIGREVALNVFCLVQIVALGVLFTHAKVTRDFVPVAYALLASLGATVLLFSIQTDIGWGPYQWKLDPSYMNICLSAALVGLIGWAAGDLRKLKNEPLALAAVAAVLLGLVSAPGAIYAIGLMVLGYARLEKPLIAAGALALPLFLFLYYYNMDVSLMQKSGILIASGAVLLAGKIYMSARGFGREEKQ